jgi:hypothetical protein
MHSALRCWLAPASAPMSDAWPLVAYVHRRYASLAGRSGMRAWLDLDSAVLQAAI